MLGVLLRLPGTWDDPAQAWPPSSQPLLPGPVGMYAAAILTFWLPALALWAAGPAGVPAGPPAAARSAAPGGRAGGSCAACWCWGRGGGGSSWAAATASATASSAASTWPSSNATRCWPSARRGRSRPTAWSSRPSWNGRATWSPPPSNPTSSGPPAPTGPTSGAVWVYDPLGLAGVPGARWTPLAYCQHLQRRPPDRPHARRRRRHRRPSGRGRQLLATARRQAPVGPAVRGRRHGPVDGRCGPVGRCPGRRRRRHTR